MQFGYWITAVGPFVHGGTGVDCHRKGGKFVRSQVAIKLSGWVRLLDGYCSPQRSSARSFLKIPPEITFAVAVKASKPTL